MLQTLMPWITTLTGTLLGGGILVPVVQHLLKRQDQSARRMMEDAAAIELAKQMAATLDDSQALKVKVLYPQWDGSGVAYAKGDRLTYQGDLYKVLQSHTSQVSWTPDKSPSLFAKVLPGQDGTQVGEWRQPDSTNPYKKGDRVTHNGHTWESTIDGNVWEPGATGVTQWKQI